MNKHIADRQIGSSSMVSMPAPPYGSRSGQGDLSQITGLEVAELRLDTRLPPPSSPYTAFHVNKLFNALALISYICGHHLSSVQTVSLTLM